MKSLHVVAARMKSPPLDAMVISVVNLTEV